jgi:cytochrome c
MRELHEWRSTVLPDGAGLPPGSGTPAQGKSIYLDKCSACHGDHGQGSGPLAPQLVGGVGTLKTGNPILTVGSYWPYATTVWDFIRRAMPYSRPGTLTADETYAVTAYLLSLNKIIPPSSVMNRKTLPEVRMPNRDGFVPDPRPDVP